MGCGAGFKQPAPLQSVDVIEKDEPFGSITAEHLLKAVTTIKLNNEGSKRFQPFFWRDIARISGYS